MHGHGLLGWRQRRTRRLVFQLLIVSCVICGATSLNFSRRHPLELPSNPKPRPDYGTSRNVTNADHRIVAATSTNADPRKGAHTPAQPRKGRGWHHMGKKPWPPIAKLERNAIGKDRWIIMTSCSCGYIDLTYNWVLHLRALKITNFLVFTEDNQSTTFFRKLLGERQIVVYHRGKQPEAVKAATYPSPEFIAQVADRPFWMESIMRQGFGVIWSDSDQVWLHSVLPQLETPGIDVFLSVDSKPGVITNNSNFCTGFIAARPTTAGIELIGRWGNLIPARGGLNQGPFNSALEELHNVKRKAIDIRVVQPGWLYFDDDYRTERAKAAVVHDNWIKGHDAKRDRFIKYKLWKVPAAWTLPAAC